MIQRAGVGLTVHVYGFSSSTGPSMTKELVA
jgi:hypothetical protein